MVKLAGWIRDWWCELIDPATYRDRSRAVSTACALGAVLALAVALSVGLQACGGAGTTITKIGHLLKAATALQELAESVADTEGTPEAAALLDEQLPQALEKLELALGELCADGGPLPQDHRVCVHFRAYQADVAP